MKLYCVYTPPDPSRPLDAARLVREGFSIWAFLFSPLWALYHRLWWVFMAAILVEMLARLAFGMDSPWYPVVQVGWAVLAGAFAYDWLGRKLRRKGWRMADVVSGRNLTEAQRRYYDRMLRA